MNDPFRERPEDIKYVSRWDEFKEGLRAFFFAFVENFSYFIIGAVMGMVAIGAIILFSLGAGSLAEEVLTPSGFWPVLKDIVVWVGAALIFALLAFMSWDTGKDSKIGTRLASKIAKKRKREK